jgi:hypothetical protein
MRKQMETSRPKLTRMVQEVKAKNKNSGVDTIVR